MKLRDAAIALHRGSPEIAEISAGTAHDEVEQRLPTELFGESEAA